MQGGHQIRPEVLRAVIDHILSMQGGEIPSFAYGGVVDRPTLAMVGDNGPEAMVPLGGGNRLTRALARRPGASSTPGAPGGPASHFLDPGTYESILAGRGQGVYGPNYLRDAAARGARMRAENARSRAGTLGRLVGLSPIQQRQALVDASIGASGDIANEVSAAGLQGMGDYQDFIRQLLGVERQSYGQNIAQTRSDEEAGRERRAQRKLGYASIAGGVAGAGLGAL